MVFLSTVLVLLLFAYRAYCAEFRQGYSRYVHWVAFVVIIVIVWLSVGKMVVDLWETPSQCLVRLAASKCIAPMCKKYKSAPSGPRDFP